MLLVAPWCCSLGRHTPGPRTELRAKMGAGLGCAEPCSNLRRQFWQLAPEKWQEAREHGDRAKNAENYPALRLENTAWPLTVGLPALTPFR